MELVKTVQVLVKNKDIQWRNLWVFRKVTLIIISLLELILKRRFHQEIPILSDEYIIYNFNSSKISKAVSMSLANSSTSFILSSFPDGNENSPFSFFTATYICLF
ncbi:hypothetical protein SAMN04488513_102585 [Pseudozobellia thermophila]|uniref:Uncharacterized protein n=1 Tax=Pseudozobellia thermophila TaxID=192903 RepID=A0A1M6FWT5_9FLAO|nr:hypothetical protein SAMN04488513_102585 [Pseudozobellia thermophila]